MTPQQLVGLGVRLFALWLALTSIGTITAILSTQLPEGAPKGLGIGMGVAYLVGSAVLWFFPMVVAHRLLPRTTQSNALSAGAIEIARAGACLLGLWLFVKTLPTAAWYVFRMAVVTGSAPAIEAFNADAKVDMAVIVFQLVLAATLILKSDSFATFAVSSSDSTGDLER
ncbi:hypothetical protein GCM10027034_14200 [Ramlibacter solisilvae]|uniref:hypothetical protein n=1 Tax=Ramlibacter tataouinensis TaxID=94132 RepID=UPI000776CD54|nr:hypothetical protein [Ramlibacter tataouinensis]